MPSIDRWRYPTSGIASIMISPSVLMMKRMTPWVDGCCGPMFSVISSPLSYAKMISLIFHRLLLVLGGRLVEDGQQLQRVGARRRHAAVRLGLLVVLAQRMADPVVGQHDAPQVGMADVLDAHQVELLALVPVG